MSRLNPTNAGQSTIGAPLEKDGKPKYQHESARSLALLEHRITSIERKTLSKPLTSFHTAKSTAAHDIDADLYKLYAWCDVLEIRLDAIDGGYEGSSSREAEDHNSTFLSGLEHVKGKLDAFVRKHPASRDLTEFIADSAARFENFERHMVKAQAAQEASSVEMNRLRDLIQDEPAPRRLDEDNTAINQRIDELQVLMQKLRGEVEARQLETDTSVMFGRLNDLEAQLEDMQTGDSAQRIDQDSSNILNRLIELETQVKRMQQNRRSTEADPITATRIKQLEMLLEMLQVKRLQANEAQDGRLKKLEELIRPFDRYQAEVQDSVKHLAKMREMVKTHIEKGDMKGEIVREVMQAVKDDRDEFYRAVGGCENDIKVLTQCVHKLRQDTEAGKHRQESEVKRPQVMSTTALAESLAERIVHGEPTEMEAMISLSHALQKAISRASESRGPIRLPNTPDGSTDNQMDNVDRSPQHMTQSSTTPIPRVHASARKPAQPQPFSVSFDGSNVPSNSPSGKMESRKRKRASPANPGETEIRRTSRTHVPTKKGEEYEEFKAESARSRR